VITVYIYHDGKTKKTDRVEPQWLDPASGVTLWVDVIQPTPEEGQQLLADFTGQHSVHAQVTGQPGRRKLSDIKPLAS